MQCDMNRPVIIEAESSKIGQIHIQMVMEKNDIVTKHNDHR